MYAVAIFLTTGLHRRCVSKTPVLHHFIRPISTGTTSPPPPPPNLPLSHPIYVIWASNTGLGKTLVSTGLAASSVLSSNPAKFIYIKPVQTGFPTDSDSRFVYHKLSQLFLRRKPPIGLLASNHALKASAPATKAIFENEEFEEYGLRNLGLYEERRLGGEESAFANSELVCKTLCSWKEAISPHLAAEREGGAVSDSALLEMLRSCLGIGLDGNENKKVDAWTVVETAGGVASPGPSGSLQCDLYR